MNAPPRRLSTEDADYDSTIGMRVCVLLDGIEQRRLIAYDVDAGTVTRAKLNEAGEIYCVGDEVAMEVASGLVEVHWHG